MEKSLEYFMRPEAKEDKIITVPGPETIKDENGNVVDIQIKVLSTKEIDDINNMYSVRVPAKDRKGNYIIDRGTLVYKDERDNGKASRHLMVASLVYPNLKDPKLMEYFGCVDVTEMPFKVFPTNAEFGYVSNQIMIALGLREKEEKEETEKDIEAAKNS